MMVSIRSRYAGASLLKTTLVFLRRNDEVLLAMKKRGFGAGQWNGPGGKIEDGESPEVAARREVSEEIGVEMKNINKVAQMEFYLEKSHKDYPKHVHCIIYVCNEWDGEPSESEEMAPRWFGVQDVPYGEMWPDDKFWLPHVLAGAEVVGEFELGRDNSLLAWTVQSIKR